MLMLFASWLLNTIYLCQTYGKAMNFSLPLKTCETACTSVYQEIERFARVFKLSVVRGIIILSEGIMSRDYLICLINCHITKISVCWTV